MYQGAIAYVRVEGVKPEGCNPKGAGESSSLW